MSDTPRTDKAWDGEPGSEYYEVPDTLIDLCRKMEKELQVVTEQRDKAIAIALDLDRCIELSGSWQSSERAHAELFWLRRKINPLLKVCENGERCPACTEFGGMAIKGEFLQ